MLLDRVEVRNAQSTVLTLALYDPEGGYYVKDIEGLDPVKALIVSSSFARLDGEQYQSSRREKRNLIAKVGLEPDYSTSSVSELRKRLYNIFMPKTRVTLRFFEDDGFYVDISGRVESFDSPRFAKEPDATISILCFNPDFIAPVPVVISGNTTASTNVLNIPYNGTVETGVVFRMNVNRDLQGFMLHNMPVDDVSRALQFIAPLVAGDVLEISTVSGAKGATLTRDGQTRSILYGISPYSDWINLYPGNNEFRVYAEGATIPYTLEYTTKYGGL